MVLCDIVLKSIGAYFVSSHARTHLCTSILCHCTIIATLQDLVNSLLYGSSGFGQAVGSTSALGLGSDASGHMCDSTTVLMLVAVLPSSTCA